MIAESKTSQVEGIFPLREDDGSDLRNLISKRKEQHRVEIRRQQNNQKFRTHRVNISSQVQEASRLKEFSDNNESDYSQLNLEASISGLKRAHQEMDLSIIRTEVRQIRMCVTLEHKLRELESSNNLLHSHEVLPRLIVFLEPKFDEEEYELQRDIMWIIAHFLSQMNLRHILFVVQNVPLQVFYRLITSQHIHENIKFNALLALYNILDDNQVGAQHLLSNGIISFMKTVAIDVIQQHPSLLEHTVLLIKDILACTAQQITFFELDKLAEIIEVIPVLFLLAKKDLKVQDNLFEAICSLTERDDDDIDDFFSSQNGMVIKVINYLKQSHKEDFAYLIVPLRIIHNLSNSYDHISVEMIHFDMLDTLSLLAKHRSNKVKRMIASILSNICASGSKSIQLMMHHRVIVFDMINLIENSETDFMLRKESLVALSHLLMAISKKHVEEFVEDYEPLKLLIDNLIYVDVDLNEKIMKALLILVNLGEDLKNKKNYLYNKFARLFNRLGGRKKVESFTFSFNPRLSSIAENLLASSYEIDEEELYILNEHEQEEHKNLVFNPEDEEKEYQSDLDDESRE